MADQLIKFSRQIRFFYSFAIQAMKESKLGENYAKF